MTNQLQRLSAELAGVIAGAERGDGFDGAGLDAVRQVRAELAWLGAALDADWSADLQRRLIAHAADADAPTANLLGEAACLLLLHQTIMDPPDAALGHEGADRC